MNMDSSGFSFIPESTEVVRYRVDLSLGEIDYGMRVDSLHAEIETVEASIKDAGSLELQSLYDRKRELLSRLLDAGIMHDTQARLKTERTTFQTEFEPEFGE